MGALERTIRLYYEGYVKGSESGGFEVQGCRVWGLGGSGFSGSGFGIGIRLRGLKV